MQVIKDNLLLKFVSLIVATILFVMLNAESSTPVEVDFPISYNVPSGFVLVGHPPSNVSTTLQSVDAVSDFSRGRYATGLGRPLGNG